MVKCRPFLSAAKGRADLGTWELQELLLLFEFLKWSLKKIFVEWLQKTKFWFRILRWQYYNVIDKGSSIFRTKNGFIIILKVTLYIDKNQHDKTEKYCQLRLK